MIGRIKERVSPALVVSVVAVVCAGAGTAAAGGLMDGRDVRNSSLTSADIRNGSILSRDIRNGSIRSADLNDSTEGALAGRDGERGPQGLTGERGPQGLTGERGLPGDDGFSALDPLPSGQTISGVIGGDYHNFDAAQSVDFGVNETLPLRATAALLDGDVSVNVAGQQQDAGQTPATTTDTSAGCSGTPASPTAPAGDVCIYVSGADGAQNLSGYSATFGASGVPFGFKLKWDASGTAGDSFVDATWAYTAP
jgi:hypothetical protein